MFINLSQFVKKQSIQTTKNHIKYELKYEQLTDSKYDAANVWK